MLLEHARHLLRRQDAVGDAGLVRGPRHAVELRALDVLDDHQAAGVVDVADAARAVAAAARQHDRDRARAAVLRERAEEHVDRQRQLLLAIALAEQQPAAGDDHLLLRRDQIDVVGLDQHAVLDELDRQLGVAPEQLVHQALEVRRQVLDDDERHLGVGREVVEEVLERFESAGGGADADHEGRGLGGRADLRGIVIHGCSALAEAFCKRNTAA